MMVTGGRWRVNRALIERAQAGDGDAYARVAAQASDRLFAIAVRVLRDHDAARDALQSALVLIWRDLPKLRDPELFEPWSRRVIVNCCHSARRRARRSVVDAGRSGGQPSVGDSQLSLAMRDELERAFARLTVDQRAVVVLLYYMDQSVAEIAATLGISTGTVKSRLHAASRALRAALEADARLPMLEERLL
jgi:RNA polymerase sigma-70 factor (ECF subfamily)